jgi:hypothetical protein
VTFECGGPRVYCCKELLRTVARAKPVCAGLLLPCHLPHGTALAWVAELLPNPPFARNQVELMQVDTALSPEMSGFGQLGISPRSIEDMLRELLRCERPWRLAMIRKLKSGGYRLYSRKVNPKTGKRRNLGTFRTRAAAERHERAVQYFKRH